MKSQEESNLISLGNETAEGLGFKTESQVETALIPLMADVFSDKIIKLKKEFKR